MFRRFIGLLFATFTLALVGCGKSENKVTGRVTCGDKPVTGTLLFSPLGQGADNTGEVVGVPLNADGSYEVRLTTTGKHRVVVRPADIVYPAKPGQEYPCDLSPQEHDVKPGGGEIIIALQHRAKK